MAERIEAGIPNVVSPGLKAVISKDEQDFLGTEFATKAQDIVRAVQTILPAVLNLRGNEGKTGFTIGITRRELGFPIYIVQLGDIPQPDKKYPGGKAEKYAEFAGLKAYILQIYPDLLASKENANLPELNRVRSTWGDEIPGGAFELNGWIISGSGLPKAEMDEAVILAAAFGSKIATYDQISRTARDRRVQCHTFFENEHRLLEPFYSQVKPMPPTKSILRPLK